MSTATISLSADEARLVLTSLAVSATDDEDAAQDAALDSLYDRLTTFVSGAA